MSMRALGPGRLFIVSLAVVLAGCGSDSGSASGEPGADSQGTIKIGVPVPLSGDTADSGVDMLHGAELAIEEINAAGGVLGRQVELVPVDDRCDPRTAPAVAKTLLERGVVGVAGGYCSGAAIPQSAALHADGIPYITIATNPALTQRGVDTVFQIAGRDDRQGAFAAQFLAGPARAKRLAVLHDNTTYSRGLAQYTRTANKDLKLGMQIVFFGAIKPGENDYSATLSKIRDSGADTVYFTGYTPEGGLIVRQARKLGLAVRIIGGDATNEPAVITRAGPAAEGFIVTTAPLPEFLPGATAFINAYTERFGEVPGGFSVYEYDAVKVLADAITQAVSTAPREITAALRTIRSAGITGEIAFNASGDRDTIIYVTAIVEDGKFRPHKRMGGNGKWSNAS